MTSTPDPIIGLARNLSRARRLEAESRCPVCGAARLRFTAFGAGTGSAEARYACGAILSTFLDNPVTAMRTCPAPTLTAVMLMERALAEG